MKLSRRGLIASSAALAALPGAALAHSRRQRRPNVVWIVCHDIHAPLLGCYGNPLARTPTIDALARDGIRYDQAFTTQPVCSPSRFALITGVYPQACAPAHQMRAEAQLPPEITPLPLLMRAGGYYCTNNTFTDYNTNTNEAALWEECSQTAHWRNRPKDTPFFCVYNYMITHEGQVFGHSATATDPASVTIPPFLPDRPEVRQVLARNIDMVNRQDVAVAHLLQELETDGLAEDTVVIFMADHGGVHPRSKRYCYDDGLRVPMIVRIPARWRSLARSPLGQPSDELISHVDLAPTVLSLAGIPRPAAMMGRAFLGRQKDPQRRMAFSMRDRMDERYDLVHTVRTARHRYIRNYVPQRIYGQHEAYEWQSEAYQAWERAQLAGELNEVQGRFWRAKPTEELYDVVADPHQVTNLAEDPAHAGHLIAMRHALDAHLVEINDNGFIPEGTRAEGYTASRQPGAYPLKLIIEAANRAIARDPANVPQFLSGLDHPNEIVRFWNAHGLALAPAMPAEAVAAVAHRLETEPADQVLCVLSEVLITAGRPEVARTRLADILQRSSAPWTRLRALNVLTILSPEQLRPLRETIVKTSAEGDEYLQRAGLYLLARIDGSYQPDSRLVGRPKYKVDAAHPVGDPSI